MQKNRKLQIEYILPAIIFASVIWGIFAGFRVSRYQWIMISGSVVLFLGICTLCDRLKQTVYLMIESKYGSWILLLCISTDGKQP